MCGKGLEGGLGLEWEGLEEVENDCGWLGCCFGVGKKGVRGPCLGVGDGGVTSYSQEHVGGRIE